MYHLLFADIALNHLSYTHIGGRENKAKVGKVSCELYILNSERYKDLGKQQQFELSLYIAR